MCLFSRYLALLVGYRLTGPPASPPKQIEAQPRMVIRMFGGNFAATGVDDNSVEVQSVAVAIADAGANVYRPGDSEQLHHEERQQMSDDHRVSKQKIVHILKKA